MANFPTMSLNELRNWFIKYNKRNDLHHFVLVDDIRVIKSRLMIESVEYKNKVKDKFEDADAPKIKKPDDVLLICLDYLNDKDLESNQFLASDGLRILTLEVDDPNKKIVYDWFLELLGKDYLG